MSPSASADEIRRSYLGKIKQYHPDRVASLGPEFLALAEARAKLLNAAYAEALRARGLRPTPPPPEEKEADWAAAHWEKVKQMINEQNMRNVS